MAAGRVRTGFSLPVVAIYTNTDGVVSYSDTQQLARGVSVSLEVDTTDDNNFYADNVVAESDSGSFESGTVTLTVDGLFQAAEQLIMGLPKADTDGFMAYNASQNKPYVGVGYLVRYRSGGVTTWVPTVLPKVMFADPGEEVETSEDTTNFQTQDLEGSIYRDDTDDANWKYIGAEYATEATAYAALFAKLGGSTESESSTESEE